MFIGEVLVDRYLIRKKIKKTKYSCLWLAEDIKFGINVCVKVFKAAPYFTEVAISEIKALQTVYIKAKEEAWMN